MPLAFSHLFDIYLVSQCWLSNPMIMKDKVKYEYVHVIGSSLSRCGIINFSFLSARVWSGSTYAGWMMALGNTTNPWNLLLCPPLRFPDRSIHVHLLVHDTAGGGVSTIDIVAGPHVSAIAWEDYYLPWGRLSVCQKRLTLNSLRLRPYIPLPAPMLAMEHLPPAFVTLHVCYNV